MRARVVSMPSWNLFEKQDEAYRESVLPSSIKKRVTVEAGCSTGLASLGGRRDDHRDRSLRRIGSRR